MLLNRSSKCYFVLKAIVLFGIFYSILTIMMCQSSCSVHWSFYMWPQLDNSTTLTNHQLHQTSPPPRNFPSLNRTIVILMWTTFLGDVTWQNNTNSMRLLSNNRKCEFISDKDRLSHADYVFFQSMSVTDFPSHRSPHNRWVFFNLEPPTSMSNWWLNVTFNYSSTYSHDTDFPQPYGKCKLIANGMNDNGNYVSDIIKDKTSLVAWFVTNCNTQSERMQYVNELKKYIPVDIFGGCGERTCWRFNKKCEETVSQKYKFYLSFESALCKDYVTEKAFRPLVSKYPMVPVVMGHANYNKILPPHSFIDVRWFNSPKELAQYLRYLNRNNAEYVKYFEWRRNYSCGFFALDFASFCDRAYSLYDISSPFSNSVSKFAFNHECITKENFFQVTEFPTDFPTWLF